MRLVPTLPLIALLLAAVPVHAADGNRLTYLDGSDPYYVSRTFPKLTTPQWVGEDGVEAVVILAIDDMRGHDKWEAFLRPILTRLQQIDGRAPVSIMTCQIDPEQPHLQKWLKEGVSLETHTIDHPCPFFKDGFDKAKSTYERCVDLLSAVPNSKPVAFRMPCCDSLNTPSPRFWAEIFNKTTAKGNFLQVDSSVFNVLTANDPELPRDLVLDADGSERFRKYLPADRSFVNTIEDYPYPYVINRLCWEFPCVTPSDWQANHLHKPNNPVTVRDWKAALDATVIKQGVFCIVFHPHGWIKNEQIVELIDHAEAKHGKKVRFLTFREALERMNKNLLGGQPLRDPKNGQDNGVRLLDVNKDGFLDVVIGNDVRKQTRLWSPKTRNWTVTDFPIELVYPGTSTDKDGTKTFRQDAGAHFGVFRPDGNASVLPNRDVHHVGWHFDGARWIKDEFLQNGLTIMRRAAVVHREGANHGIQLRDLDGDGVCEIIVADTEERKVLAWSAQEKSWKELPFTIPGKFTLVPGHDPGAHFIDIDEDGHDDLIFSDDRRFGLFLFSSMKEGWSRKVLEGKPSEKSALPMIARDGKDNGFWAHSRSLWWSNEDTVLLKDHVDRRSFNELLTDVEPQAKTPEASLRSIRTRPGFEVELVAAEPLVEDPIAFAWGPDGKLWVVEMGDYPLGSDGKGKHGGRVKFLEDTDGDGKYDKATLFLDGLGYPTGVTPWRKGVLVTCAPDIFYAEDTDGDGKADKREVLYTGFTEGNQQHRVNGLVWGLDNWLYGANGDSGGRVKSLKTGAEVNLSGRDFRIRPDDGRIELVSGQSQFGRSRDDWGNWFGCNNSNPMWHYALDDHYLRRNPHVPAPDLRVPVSVAPGAAPVFPVSRTLPRFNDLHTANRFTSACSVIVYRDDLFGPAFEGSTFVSEPVHDLVHREVMTADGFTFKSRRAADEQQSEFLASSDNWFRPTTIKTGPDGALWVADMYRFVIEHPQWIPADWQKRLDLRAGHDKGRIYRVYPVGKKPRAIPRLDKLDAAGLVAALDSPSGWQRDLAQQMLTWRLQPGEEATQAVGLLKKMVTDCERPLGRLHALCTLSDLTPVDEAILQRALADPHPGVRRHAIRVCEQYGNLRPAMVKLVADPDPQVRLQLAYSLGLWDSDPQAAKALAQLAVRDGGDRFAAAAVLSSVTPKNLEPVLLAVLNESKTAPPPAPIIEGLLRTATAQDNGKAVTTALSAVATPKDSKFEAWQFGALAGLLDALDARNTSLARLAENGDAELKAAVKRLPAVFDAARAAVAKKETPRPEQLLAVRLLGRGPDHQQEDLAVLAELLTPQTADDLQGAAVAALGRLREPKVPEVLLGGWKGYAPTLRSQVLDVLLRRPDWLRAALDAVEAKKVLPFEIDAARRQQLLQHKDATVRARAAKLFTDAVDPDRQKVVESYRDALTLTGDAARGVTLFTKTCAACHRFNNVGNAVGPDLGSLGDKSPEGLLVAMLDPNRAVEARYVGYQAVTNNGLTFNGVLAAETGTSITLVGLDGKEQVILRSNLAELTSSGKSAMPEGLEKELKPQDLADLIAYLRAGESPLKPKVFDGNTPSVVKPGADGVLLLPASACEIYGGSLVLEKQYGNLGYWTREDDHAVWTVDVAKAGKYAVWLDWACDDGAAGNAFVLQAGTERLTGRVAGTGTWDKYKQAKVGEIALAAGQQRVVLRSAGKITGALIDLRSIKLVPN